MSASSEKINVGILIDGAVAPTFGRSIKKAERDLDELKSHIGRPGNLSPAMDAIEPMTAKRRADLDRVRGLRGDVNAAQLNRTQATGQVADLGRQLGAARAAHKQAHEASVALDPQRQELEALKTQRAANRQQLASKRGEIGAARSQGADKGQIAALRAEATALANSVRQSGAAIKQQTAQINAAEQAAQQAAAAELALSKAFDAARQNAGQAKRAFESKRAELHQLKAALRDTGSAMQSTTTGAHHLDAALNLKTSSAIGGLKEIGKEADHTAQKFAKLDKVAQELDLKAKGQRSMSAGRQDLRSAATMATGESLAMIAPVITANDYQATVRDMAIKGGFANTQQERDLGGNIRQSAAKNGIGQGELAQAINQLVSGGMDAKESGGYADLIGKFSVGQGVSTVDTAAMIQAISQNAGIHDAAGMEKALESISYMGQAGNFEAADMAKWFPALLAKMQSLGITGQESVNTLGAMLQINRRTAGSADEAANNLDNWFSKIGSEETVKNYKDAGIDYTGSMQQGIKSGSNTLETSLKLAQHYIEKTDPNKSKKIQDFAAQIKNVKDPKEKEAQLKAFEESIKTGNLFNDRQVKAALMAYMQNEDEYKKLKHGGESANVMDKNLAERREISAAKWAQAGHAFEASLESIGTALQPLTDKLADAATGLANLTNSAANLHPAATQTVVVLGAVAAGLLALRGGARMASGLLNVARGGALARTKPPVAIGTPANIAPAMAAIAPKSATAIAGEHNAAALAKMSPMAAGMSKSAVSAAVPGSALGEIAPKSSLLKKLGSGPGLAVLGAGLQAAETYMTAETAEQKGRGYGGAVGGAAGSYSGALGGAAIGTLILPGIGTAIGGLIGGIVGGMAGEWGGSELGEKLASHFAPQDMSLALPAEQKEAALKQRAENYPEEVRQGGEIKNTGAAPAGGKSPITQTNAYSPSISVKVDGDVKDPGQVAEALFPHLKRLFDAYTQNAANAALYDHG